MHTENNLDDPTSPPTAQPKDNNLHKIRSAYEAQVEKTNRKDEVEPRLPAFRKKRDLHIRQMKDTEKRIKMVGNRIDKLNEDIEKLRNQWGELEREKATLLITNERYEQTKAKQQKIMLKDDRMAKRYQDYLTLAQEVLVLDSSEDEEDEDAAMVDWGTQGQDGRGRSGEDEVEHVQ